MNNMLIQAGVLWPMQRYFSRKTLEVNVFLFFICMAILWPLREISLSYQYPVTGFVLPHLLAYLYFQLGFFAAVIYFFSDIPFMNVWEMNRVMRMGRRKWIAGCIWTIVLHSYFLMVNVFLLTLVPLLGITEWNKDWGKLLYTLSSMGDERLFFSISYRILSGYTPGMAMVLCIGLGGAVISVIGLIMFVISLWINRMIALAAATILTALPLMAENLSNLYNNLKIWYYSPISWIRLDFIEWEYVRGLPGIDYIIPALFFIFIICCLLIFIKAKKVEFHWNHEETV